MNLLQLPTEILLIILRLKGSAFFRRNIRRLVVSKSWYELARLVLLQDLQLSAKSLPKFLKADMSSLVHQHTRTVKVAFDVVRDRWAVSSGSRHVWRIVVTDWTTNVDNDLTSLASILQGCSNLRSLKLRPRPRPRPLGMISQTWLSSDALVSLLSVGHLTCLEFDTVSTGLRSTTSHRRSDICEVIRALLPTLRRLRCRMRKICPRILLPPEEGPLLSLEEVIINLNLGDPTSHDPPQHAYRCGIFVSGSPATWKAEMESGAKDLVDRMATPRVVRVLSRSPSGPQTECFDAIAQRRMMLAPSAAWDADGEEVVETAADEGS
ncbi:uncharacterized protein NECHADRAFT_83113 [Fusarium vanettenii 77-13-4]|uniref:F-box domain-containing protein n=1 Tax=Fusarium vanettenii (strain ATCC MYA-4622 / CBS 123669 / FGSC 9596 / NRRL 45880 / 77-13-4) TaxID=660122 RepID=C7ZBE0_FUSV7|nr:uncharacterized protein NECHADRAFT_83113 [Fusarium vanettenii 77-13-4]EEU38824.1 hypothetical protein NECHADRAFT_83113 [Fusarium vanettenii 77-13-4]